MADLWAKWNSEHPVRRAFFEDQARANHQPTQSALDLTAQPNQVTAIPAETENGKPHGSFVKSEASFSGAEFPSSLLGAGAECSAIPESDPQKSSDLQGLLKNADPETLERSVEEGVALLDDLKVPLMEKMADSPDAEQWIQQIGKLVTNCRGLHI